jgi:serine/threonine protein kinase
MNTNNGNKIIGSYIIDLNKRLGKGAYGEVYLGKHKDT